MKQEIIGDEEPKAELKPTSAKMKPEMINAIDEKKKKKRYANRSEVIRMALRDLIRQYEGRY